MSAFDDIKQQLQSISTREIQDRIDGDIHQEATTINNYFGGSCGRGSRDEYEYIDMSQATEDEKKHFIGDSYSTPVGIHPVGGKIYDFGNDEDLEVGVDINKKTTPIEEFNNNLELVAEYGTYKNYKKGITIEERVAKRSFFTRLSTIKKEVEVSNRAKRVLREKLQEATKPFVNESNIKATEAKNVAYGMKVLNERKLKEANDIARGSQGILSEIKDLLGDLVNKQPTSQDIADSLVSKIYGNAQPQLSQPQEYDYDVEILERVYR